MIMHEYLTVGLLWNMYFNRYNIKLSYSCMPNMKKRIGRNNRFILNSEAEEVVEPCVCTQYECPLQSDCGKKNVVYQAEVTTEELSST